ncbi:MAG TPA: hypothetical protein VMJ10_02110 [Kofleriaceae bacterium]|nr:hypothetical protein [Kofleriaceae bacterium]
MRRLALALAPVVAAGCNQLFGLHDTKMLDAPPGDAPDAFAPTLSITRQVLARAGMQQVITNVWSTTDPVPTVRVGTLDGALTDLSVDDQGHFVVPAELVTGTYRIVYQLPSDPVPTEIVWTGMQGTFTVPLLGRAERAMPPAGAQLEFAPTGATTFISPTILTSGLWTTTSVAGVLGSPQSFPYPYTGSSVTLSGPFGSLDGSMGDVEVLTSTDGTNGKGTSGFAVMEVAQLVAGTMVTATSTWVVPGTAGAASASPTFTTDNLETDLYVPLGGFISQPPVELYQAGVLATTDMLAFDQPVPGDLDNGGFLPLWSSSGVATPMKFANPFDGNNGPAPKLPLATFGRYTMTRSYNGLSLTSGYESAGGPTASLDFDVGVAQHVSFGGAALTESASDGTPTVTATTSTIPLSFGIAMQTSIDDCIVTLYQVSGTSLVPQYRYQMISLPTANAPLPIDGSLLLAGSSYTFGIACRKGTRTMTDFTQVSLPFVESMIYTAVFAVTS